MLRCPEHYLKHPALIGALLDDGLGEGTDLPQVQIVKTPGASHEFEDFQQELLQQVQAFARGPGGNRVEVANAGARFILAPDWKTIIWNEAE